MSKWRYRCPQGHSAWRPVGNGYWCEPCDHTYSSLLDAKRGTLVGNVGGGTA